MKKTYVKKHWVFIVIVFSVLVLINNIRFFASGQEVTFDEIKSSYHKVTIDSPRNGSIYNNENQIPLNVTVDYVYTERYVPWRVLSRLFYSIDGEPAKILATVFSGYTTSIPYLYGGEIDVSGLSNGLHEIVVVAEFSVDVSHVYVANYNYSSSPATFSVFRDLPTSSPEPTAPVSPTPFPTDYTGVGISEAEIIIGLAVIVALVIVGLGLLFYFIKRK